MSLEPGAVVVDRVWKRFRTDRQAKDLRGRIAQLRQRRTPKGERWRWALQDIGFAIEPGEAVGLIGPNGSGKSTLLRLLTRVMYPYAGSIEVGGRIGALIEVQGGIHPELSGRENIELYGTLLGLRRSEVARRFDAIVEFAELESAIDRQVKFYSSGMRMRLGFAVAAFLEPDVLLVDEVLAVGDATFQQRCLERMREVLAQGTTLVFVSHDLAAVEATCDRGVWLRDGTKAADGPIADTLAAYRDWIEETARGGGHVGGIVGLSTCEVSAPSGQPASQESLDLRMVLDSAAPRQASLCVGLSDGTAMPTVVLRRELQLVAGAVEARCRIRHLPLPRGRFYVWVSVIDGKRDLLPWHPAASFDVTGPDLDKPPPGVVRPAPVHVDTVWEEQRLPS